MSLIDVKLKKEYRSLLDNVVQDFYIPLLKQAILYQRAVGFFSSSSLIEISKGIATMAFAGGKIQIVASPYLSDEDIKAIKKGYADREKVIENALLSQLSDEHADYYSMERLNLLANLIADGILDIRIAVTDKNNEFGMYHEKMGMIEDADGNVVATFYPEMQEGISASSAYKMLVMLRAVINEGTGGRVRRLGITADMGGKTGTTNSNSDGWFMGFTPSLVSGCWVGGENRDIHFDTMAYGQGASMALPIWAAYMKQVYEDPTLGYDQSESFKFPANYDPCSDDGIDMTDKTVAEGLDEIFE